MFIRRFARNQAGAAAVEFAIVAPVLAILLLGILSYGGYFWMSHALQQLANDSARSALAGLTSAERQALAAQTTQAELPRYAFLDASMASVVVESSDDEIRFEILYDASDSPFFALGSLVPMPSPTISRVAVVRLGGY